MVKASIEVVKNRDGRVESGTVIVQGKKLRFNNVWDDDGFLRSINFDGREVPSFAELYWFMNEKFIERIRRIDLIDLITEITTIKDIDHIALIDTITNIGNMASLGTITELETVYEVKELSHVSHANVTQNLIKNGSFDSLTLGHYVAALPKEWTIEGAESVDGISRSEEGGCVRLPPTKYVEQYLMPLYGDETVFSLWLYSEYNNITLQVLFTFSDATTETFTFNSIVATWKFCLCELTTHKRLESIRLTNIGAVYDVFVDDVNGTPLSIAIVSATDLDIRLLTTADRVETCPDSDTAALADGQNNLVRIPIDAAVRFMYESVYPMMFNGATWDRIRGTVARGLLVKIDRENLLIINADLATNAAPQAVLAAVAGQYHKVYGWDYVCDAAGTFEFQCTIGGATRKFARRKTAGVHAMTLVHPIVCDVNSALNFLSNGGNTYYSLRYITEA